MRVTYTPTVADTLAAYRLHSRPGRARLVVVAAVMAAGSWVAFSETDRSLGSLLITIAVGIVAYGGMAAGIWFGVLPWWVRRVYRQQKNLHEAVTLEWDAAGLRARTGRGQAAMAWADYVKRRENEVVLLLYQSDALFQFVPLRVLSGEEAASLAGFVSGLRIR